MDEAATTRRAAREVLADVDPTELRTTLTDVLDAGSMAPGALTLLSARAADDDVELSTVEERAAGVQLIYDGLRLTRDLAREEPWVDADAEADIDADLDILAVNVLVSRGFYLLARTGAAEKAVATIRAFGRDQTLLQARTHTDEERTALDGGLEREVLELAVIAGSTAVNADPDPDLLAHARDLARTAGTPLPPAEAVFVAHDDAPGFDPTAVDQVRPSATDS